MVERISSHYPNGHQNQNDTTTTSAISNHIIGSKASQTKTNTNTNKNDRTAAPHHLIWKLLQVFLFSLLLWSNLRGPSSQCKTFLLRNAASTTSSSALHHSKTAVAFPVSDNRVPKGGIDAVLATSNTNPPFHFLAHSRQNDFVTDSIVQSGIYEADSTTALIDQIVCHGINNTNNENSDDDTNNNYYTVLDLGANIGFHSLHMASCGAAVISFEASPDTAWLLRSSALLNGYLHLHNNNKPQQPQPFSLTLIPKGVSNTTTSGRLSRQKNSPGMTSFIQGDTNFDFQSDTKGGALDVDIPIVRAQDILREELQVSSQSHHLRLLKLDVEGFEYQALQGLDLQQYPFEYITLEFFPTLLAGSGSGQDPAELLVYIWKQGYRYLKFDKDLTLEQYPLVHTGNTEEAVRTWAQTMVNNGIKEKGKGYHVNLLAQKKRRR